MANALIYAERCLLIIIGLTYRSKNSAEIGHHGKMRLSDLKGLCRQFRIG
jgi:hypothetical protein